MTAIERLEIEAACTRLIHSYATLNDAARWDEVVALYAKDGLMTRPSAPDAPIVGRDALLAAFRARPPRPSRHVCSNVVVMVEDSGNASAHSLILLFTGIADAEGGLPQRGDAPPLVGEYHDRFVRTPEGWRFAERRGAMCFA